MEKRFVHTVYFWLHKDKSQEDRKSFEAGAQSLGTIKSLDSFHLGVPASTDRPVIDNSYDYCLVCAFVNHQAHDAYQEDPIHDLFRDHCSKYWDRVLIYDSVNVL